ncbi:DUF4231 domain-containing protein [Streptomyces massasporeus]
MDVDFWWRRQSIWSQAARGLKKRVQLGRRLVLLLAVISAAAGTVSTQINAGAEYYAFVAAVAAGATPLVGRLSGPSTVQDWTRLRSTSEAIKTEVYMYLAAVTPYRGAKSGDQLWETCARIEKASRDVAGYTAGLASLSRNLPPVHGIRSYLTERVEHQVQSYYRPRAIEMTKKERIVQRTSIALAMVGAILAATSGAFQVTEGAAWVAVCSTVATAVIAYGAAAHYSHQKTEYTCAADELERLISHRGDSVASYQEEDRFVARCESIISAQNDAWMTSWSNEGES